MPHFTYKLPDKSTLKQGDIISRTQEIEELLKEVHPHYYRKKDYKYFIVLTQSCDLVRREGGKCKSRYISIAAVRPLSITLSRELAKYQYSEIERKIGICDNGRKQKLIQFAERLFNNNADEYFFLYREPSVGISEDYCAFLQLSIALISDSTHYETVLNAKILELKESFQHKLGYIVGTSYARIGTEDWTQSAEIKERLKEILNQSIDGIENINWIEESIYNKLMARLKKLPEGAQNLESVYGIIEEIKENKEVRKKNILITVSEVLNDLSVEKDKIDRAVRRIESSPEFVANIR